ncbi:MAG TPA: NADH-quinone oxidoreductase subunit C [Firmicutes bacterium]|uniref:NADH-quinone oxidoreductase subunit C n=1 Tax=Candidatus Fermentithermobacillus carboniphilus TaxID=3085328 RepID=A0AAT9L9J4_9FIRM|nr:MAG: NADH-quinone oxidoreductase subunit C [Candidatus Fermentithermobacillus carboniphilus]HHW18401.1 NADH-quinone oxidoreductase subunit C [Candidatus Fermentithermobacillaceae bacterium]
MGADVVSVEDREKFPSEAEVARKIKSACDGMMLSVQRLSRRRVWIEMPSGEVRAFFERVKKLWPALHLSTITGLDSGSEIEVIYHFDVDNVLVNLRVKLDANTPKVDTICDILPVSDAYERELHDVLGIEFAGRTSTPRLVLPDSWPEGSYPLRNVPKGDEKHA